MANDGKKSEKLVQAVLEELERKTPFAFDRFYDSHAAGVGKGGNFLPETPADYTFKSVKASGLLEVKSSEKHRSLENCTVRSVFSEHQIMSARRWQRAGGVGWCVFHDVKGNHFELWNMLWIVKAFLAPARERKLKPAGMFGDTRTGEDLYQILWRHL